MAVWEMIAALFVALGPILVVSYPPFQAIDFSAMNINHALIHLESILSNPSSRIHPLESSTPSIISRLQSRSLICLQAQPHFSVPIYGTQHAQHIQSGSRSLSH
jgi:hypothetical protein